MSDLDFDDVGEDVSWFLQSGPIPDLGPDTFVRHWSGVLVPRSTKRVSDYFVIAAPSAPTLGNVAGGTLGATTYFVKVSYVTSGEGETLASSESSRAVAANNLLKVTSPSPSTGASAYHVYVSTTTGTETRQTTDPIALGVDWIEPVTGLITGAALPVTDTTGWEPFNNFVPDPVPRAVYVSPVVDTGLDDALRVFATQDFNMGSGQSGLVVSELSINTWLTGKIDPNVFTVWILGTLIMRYFRAKLVLTITPGAVPYVVDFTPVVDRAPLIEHSEIVAVAAGGTPIVFPIPFHLTPNVQVTPVSAGLTSASAINVTTLGCTLLAWNGTTSTDGIVNWSASGE